jgi:YD repeat-containing protein
LTQKLSIRQQPAPFKSEPTHMFYSFSAPTRYALLTALGAVIAAVPAQVVAQSFPPPGSLNDFSDTMIETPDTSMAFDPSDVPEVRPEPDYAGTPATVQPELPETGTNNYEGPIGVTGVIDNVTTGCSYSPLSHNALRGPITDIDVPGAVGKYGLKMRRYYNSRSSQYWDHAIGLSPGWFHEYSWLLWSGGYKLVSAQGNVSDFGCGQSPVGASEGWDDGNQGPHPTGGIWRLADGGRVHFSGSGADYIEDPYGVRTTIARDRSTNRVSKVTDAGGRYLQFTYGTTPAYTDPAYGTKLLEWVEAYDGRGNRIERVHYTYTNVDSGGRDPLNPDRHIIRKMVTGVAYDDNTAASYGYRTDNVPDTPPSTFKFDPLLKSCNDKRYSGPMRQIAYEYQNLGPHGAITKEYKPNGPLVSKIEPDLPLHPTAGWLSTEFTETRGDGPTRTFTYTQFKIYDQHGPDPPDPCLDVTSNVGEGRPPQQMLDHYTDFHGNTTRLGYDSHWYINSVRDANGNTTSYERGNPPSQGGIGEIKTITHPAGVGYPATSIQYDYHLEPNALGGHYLYHVTDENEKMTTIKRDPTRHWITEIDYPADANTPASYEMFGYNGFGQVTVHLLRNGAWERFAYDRGLLTDKWNPKQGALPADDDPHIHYDYYTAADGAPGWIDRVKKVTMPANWPWNFHATETYEYDLNTSNLARPGRGLITKITHTDGRYQSFKYDPWGNKIIEWNELGEGTSYIHDNYNRVSTVTKWMYSSPNETTTYDYSPTEGGQSYLHTTNSPYWATLPTGVKTHNAYDENWRKTSASVTGRTTWFHYDLVGNLEYVTDPRGSQNDLTHYTTHTQYDTRNRKWKVWDAQGHETDFTYDNASNVTRIDHLADGSWETKTYDAVNRVLTDTVPKDNSTTITTAFNYNPSGTINWVKDGNNQQTTFEYDASDQKMKMTYPDLSFQSWAYDDAHNLKSRTTVNGETKYFAWDNRNRIYIDSWWDPNGGEWRYFGFDAASRLRRAMNGPGTWYDGVHFTADVRRNYDAAGRLTLDQQILSVNDQTSASKGVHYEYDATLRGTDGKPTRMYVPNDGYDYDFRYDDMGRFEKIFIHGGALQFQYSYDNASRLRRSRRRGNLGGPLRRRSIQREIREVYMPRSSGF